MATNRNNIDTVKIMNDYVKMCKESNCGAIGGAYEYAIHRWLTPKTTVKGITKSNTFYGDIFKMIDGRMVKIEVKTGCGELLVLDNDTVVDTDKLFKGIDYIVYCPEVDLTFPAESQGYVFERKEFIDFLYGYTGKGSFLRIKQTTNGGYRLSIQSFLSAGRPKASRTIRQYIDDECFQKDTLDTFVSEQEW